VLPVQSLWVWGRHRPCCCWQTFLFPCNRTETGRAVRACSIKPTGRKADGGSMPSALRNCGLRRLRRHRAHWPGSSSPPSCCPAGDAGIAYGLKGFLGAIIGRLPLGQYGGVFGGHLHRRAGGGGGRATSPPAGRISSFYGVLLTYLLVRGGVFLTGRIAAPAAGH